MTLLDFMAFELMVDRCLIGTAPHPFHISKFLACALPAVNGRRMTMATGAQHHKILFSPIFVIFATAIDVVHIDSRSADTLQEVTEDAQAVITGFRQDVLTLAM